MSILVRRGLVILRRVLGVFRKGLVIFEAAIWNWLLTKGRPVYAPPSLHICAASQDDVLFACTIMEVNEDPGQNLRHLPLMD